MKPEQNTEGIALHKTLFVVLLGVTNCIVATLEMWNLQVANPNQLESALFLNGFAGLIVSVVFGSVDLWLIERWGSGVRWSAATVAIMNGLVTLPLSFISIHAGAVFPPLFLFAAATFLLSITVAVVSYGLELPQKMKIARIAITPVILVCLFLVLGNLIEALDFDLSTKYFPHSSRYRKRS